MLRRLVAAGAMAMALAGAADAQQRKVVRLRGEVGPVNAVRALDRLATFDDQVVGLRVRFRSGEENGPRRRRYSADLYEGDRLLIYATRPDQTGWELLVPKGSFGLDHGDYAVDGFFVVKTAGPHQGVLSLSLWPVDEGAVRLSAAVRDEVVGN